MLPVLPTLLLSLAAGAAVVRLIRGARYIPYAIVLGLALAALAARNIQYAKLPGHPVLESQVRAGRIFIAAAYLVLPLAGALLFRRHAAQGAPSGV